MASGNRLQYRGPYAARQTIDLPSGSYKLGISIGEKDFMKFGDSQISSGSTKGFGIILGDTPILIGRTFMYETVEAITGTSLTFPLGAPASLIVDILIK